MFTNGRHHSSTHVALAIAQHTRKIKTGTKRERERKWNISAGDCRAAASAADHVIHIKLSHCSHFQHSKSNKTHDNFPFTLQAIFTGKLLLKNYLGLLVLH